MKHVIGILKMTLLKASPSHTMFHPGNSDCASEDLLPSITVRFEAILILAHNVYYALWQKKHETAIVKKFR
jgi:hypothetical protein